MELYTAQESINSKTNSIRIYCRKEAVYMEFLYVLSWMFLSIFGLVMLLRYAAEELLRDRRHIDKNKRNDR